MSNFNVGGLIADLLDYVEYDIEHFDPEYADKEVIEDFTAMREKAETLRAWLNNNPILNEYDPEGALP